MSLVPKPADWIDVFEPYDVFVPYSNHTFESRPRGLTVPVTTAEVDVTDCVTPVFTSGAASVVNVRSDPFDVPALLDATRRK